MRGGSYSALVIRDAQRRFLCLYHSKKSEHPWRFAGGKIEAGETPLVAAARELKEELGVEATGLSLVKVDQAHVDGAVWIGYFFECTGYDGELCISEQDKFSQMRFMTVEELAAADTHPELEVALEIRRKEVAKTCHS